MVAVVALALVLGGCGMMQRHSRMMGMGPVEPRPIVTPAPTVTPGGVSTVSFRREVLPIFQRNCVACHGGQLGLYLDTYDTVLAGSSRTRVVIPGAPQSSVLIQRLKGEIQPRMPFGGAPLQDREIAVIAGWIAEGAPNN